MANVLNEEKKQQVLALGRLGRLGRLLRQIQKATRIRRETASQYLKAGIAVRPPGGWGRRAAKPANEVITDFGTAKPAIAGITDANCNNCNPKTNPENLPTKGKSKAAAKPANGVITDSEVITDPNPFQRDEVGALALFPRNKWHLHRAAPAPVPALRVGKPSSWDSAEAAMRWRFGRTWWMNAVSPAATRACSGSCASCVECKRLRPAW
jgi:hypothetical protein